MSISVMQDNIAATQNLEVLQPTMAEIVAQCVVVIEQYNAIESHEQFVSDIDCDSIEGDAMSNDMDIYDMRKECVRAVAKLKKTLTNF